MGAQILRSCLLPKTILATSSRGKAGRERLRRFFSTVRQSNNLTDRQQELLLINERLLLVGRWNKNARIDDLYLLRRSATVSDSCIVIGVEVLKPKEPLLEEIDAVRGHRRSTKVTLCQAALVRVICNVGMVACTEDTA